jgi:uncharacterized Fe-S cluster protein YjdI
MIAKVHAIHVSFDTGNCQYMSSCVFYTPYIHVVEFTKTTESWIKLTEGSRAQKKNTSCPIRRVHSV